MDDPREPTQPHPASPDNPVGDALKKTTPPGITPGITPGNTPGSVPETIPVSPPGLSNASPGKTETRDALMALFNHLKSELGNVILGQQQVLDQVLITLLCGGHALLEGVPGTAKTLTVRALALLLNCRAKRIQFTPDLMPADVIGTNTYNLKTQAFDLRRGPIFTDLLLADEINRAPAKTQSALLEAMSERHSTIDGTRYELSPIFAVFATQNPVEFEGTYPLPEAQQDRFLFKIKVDYPSAQAERQILDAVNSGSPKEDLESRGLEPVMTINDLLGLRRLLPMMRVETGITDYVLKITRATREHELLVMGAGPRGSIFLLQAAKGHALLNGRDYITPDDVVGMVESVLAHRIALTAEAEVSGELPADVLRSILDEIDVPR